MYSAMDGEWVGGWGAVGNTYIMAGQTSARIHLLDCPVTGAAGSPTPVVMF